MLGNLHVRFGVGVRVKLLGLHHPNHCPALQGIINRFAGNNPVDPEVISCVIPTVCDFQYRDRKIRLCVIAVFEEV